MWSCLHDVGTWCWLWSGLLQSITIIIINHNRNNVWYKTGWIYPVVHYAPSRYIELPKSMMKLTTKTGARNQGRAFRVVRLNLWTNGPAPWKFDDNWTCRLEKTSFALIVQGCQGNDAVVLNLYEGESVDKSQMDIKRKTRDIRTWKKNLFLDMSSTNIVLSVRQNLLHRSLLTVVSTQLWTAFRDKHFPP
jgi:hypothetical protein